MLVSVLHQWLQRPQEVSELPAQITGHSQRPRLSHPAQVASGEGQLQDTVARQAPSLPCGPTQAAPCALATLPIRWKPTGSQQAWPTPAAGSQRQPLGLQAQGPAWPPAALLPLSFSSRKGSEDLEGHWIWGALCSRALAPRDLGLLSTESAQEWCWFPGSPEDQTTGRAPPGPPLWAARLQDPGLLPSGKAAPTASGLFFVSGHPPHLP